MGTYNLTVNKETQFELTAEQVALLDSIQLNESQFQVLKENISYQTEIINQDFISRKYTIQVNHLDYEVEITTELDLLIKELGFEVGASKQVNDIKAPMPGLILSIDVSPGQKVQEGDRLLILEAMKMENSFNSPRAGIIKSVYIKQGEAVDKGQLLIEFED